MNHAGHTPSVRASQNCDDLGALRCLEIEGLARAWPAAFQLAGWRNGERFA
jgi:hypothetical protein